MSTALPGVGIEGIGLWSAQAPSWDGYRDLLRGRAPAQAATRPAPAMLPPNERRRAPDTVLVALEAAQAACAAAGRDPSTLPSVFASTYGDLAITDHMCRTLATSPLELSPTRFHNSVHNAAAGYWTIGIGAMEPATALSAGSASFAMGLLEALAQLYAGAPAVLLVGYDGPSPAMLAEVAPSEGLLGGALVLARDASAGIGLVPCLEEGDAPAVPGDGNAMAPMLALFAALARGDGGASLPAGQGRHLRLELGRG